MSLFTHPGTELWQRMKATAKPGTEDWFKTWRTLSYLTKGRKNHYMLPIKEQLEKLLIKHGILKEADPAISEPLDRDRLQKLGRITRKLQADPDLIDEIFKDLSLKAKNIRGQFISRFEGMLSDLQRTQPEADQMFANFLKDYAAIVSETEGTNEEKFEFLGNLGKVDHIDVKKLASIDSTWDQWLVGTPFSKRLFLKCFSDPRLQTNNKGPGEAALAILSPRIFLKEEAEFNEELKQLLVVLPIEVKFS